MSRVRRHSAAVDGDSGFTIVEVLVALTLLAVMLLVVTRGSGVGISAAALGRQQAQASSLISGVIAQVEALPFPDVQNGFNPNAEKLSTDDPNLSSCNGSTCIVKVNGKTVGTAPTTNTHTSEAPLVPHISKVTESDVPDTGPGEIFTISTYATTTSGTANLMTVTVVVTWRSAVGDGKNTMVGQTEISAP